MMQTSLPCLQEAQVGQKSDLIRRDGGAATPSSKKTKHKKYRVVYTVVLYASFLAFVSGSYVTTLS